MASEFAKEYGINCEVVKIGMNQDKNGHVLKLAIHPNDLPQDLILDALGSRYVMVLVKLNDQDQPVKGDIKREADNLIASCGALCRNERFRNWLVGKGYALDADEEGAVSGIRHYCGILSRSEFATNENARLTFVALRDEFQSEVKRGLI